MLVELFKSSYLLQMFYVLRYVWEKINEDKLTYFLYYGNEIKRTTLTILIMKTIMYVVIKVTQWRIEVKDPVFNPGWNFSELYEWILLSGSQHTTNYITISTGTNIQLNALK